MKAIEIHSRQIGPGHPCYVISEIGNNHGGSFDTAVRMIEESARAGVDAVKFQTFRGEDVVSPRVKSDQYPGWDVADKFEYWVDFIDSLVLPWERYPELIRLARELAVHFVSTPLSTEAASFLADIGADALKIASMDVTHHPLLEHVATLGLPVIMSTGMATLAEIEEAVDILQDVPLVLLHCVSEYPLRLEDARMHNLVRLQRHFGRPVGFSDHSLGYSLDVAAVALGACVLEKHFTLDRNTPAKAEHHFSTEPAEMLELVRAIREVELALGEDGSRGDGVDRQRASSYRRSLQLVRDMKPGEVVVESDLVALRPGEGLDPRNLRRVVGRPLSRACAAYTPLQWEDLG